MAEVVGALTWSETNVSTEALFALTASFFIVPRIIDRSSEVTGEPMQQLDIPEIEEVVTNAVGPLGQVTDQQEIPSSISLVIDQQREASRLFPDVWAVQIKLNRKKNFSTMAGIAHAQFMEDSVLALEAGNTNRIDIAGDLTPTFLLQAKAGMDSRNVKFVDRATYTSPQQQTKLLLEDKLTNIDFIGPGGKKTPTTGGMLPMLYGTEPLNGTRIRRRLVGGNLRTVNMMFQKEAYAIGIQRKVTTKIEEAGIAQRIITWTLFGVIRTRDEAVELLDTGNE